MDKMNGNEIREYNPGQFYDNVYYKNIKDNIKVSRHLKRLASKVGIRKGQWVLDVACGTGEWLLTANTIGAIPSGIDISRKAVQVCCTSMPKGTFCTASAELLPFLNGKFDVVSCLGALEHFANPERALKDMIRVAKEDAVFLLLVPNAGFLTRRLGLYNGTEQVEIKEEVRSLQGWQELFESAGLSVKERWSDLHILSWAWITTGPVYKIPFRLLQALALAVWPLPWQYQIYYLCKKI